MPVFVNGLMEIKYYLFMYVFMSLHSDVMTIIMIINIKDRKVSLKGQPVKLKEKLDQNPNES